MVVVVVGVLLIPGASAACSRAGNYATNLQYGCCKQANLASIVWVDSGYRYDLVTDKKMTSSTPPGSDFPTCGNVTHPCLSIKYATSNRVASGGKVMLVDNGYYAGPNNRNLLLQGTGGGHYFGGSGTDMCDNLGPYHIETANVTRRAMIDLEFEDRFLTLAGSTDPSTYWGDWWEHYSASTSGEAHLTLKNLMFMRGTAKYSSNSEGQMGSAFTTGYNAFCPTTDPPFYPSWYKCPCNRSEAANGTFYDKNTGLCKQKTLPPLGFGGVLQLWGGYKHLSLIHISEPTRPY
eukprot:TRINITY_DN4087_c0_g1_i1.p1 TRINITY_DN4087_c0_g1~~TRINITY_DN4087_c0_g1_i1.p1  ORF type:complete len:291 (-),score=54.43 TRINITY_DN4087_c0_g1_i1:84-956(-)